MRGSSARRAWQLYSAPAWVLLGPGDRSNAAIRSAAADLTTSIRRIRASVMGPAYSFADCGNEIPQRNKSHRKLASTRVDFRGICSALSMANSQPAVEWVRLLDDPALSVFRNARLWAAVRALNFFPPPRHPAFTALSSLNHRLWAASANRPDQELYELRF